jgi:hypothetical protein
MADLQLLDSVALANSGEKLVLLHPSTEEELDITITLMGSDSDEYRTTIKKRFEQAQRQQAKSKKGNEIDLDEAEDKSRDLLAKMTLSWENVEEAGKKVSCTFESAKDLYKKYPWIREQVEKFISDRSNFIKG